MYMRIDVYGATGWGIGGFVLRYHITVTSTNELNIQYGVRDYEDSDWKGFYGM